MKRGPIYLAAMFVILWFASAFAVSQLPSDSFYRLDLPLTIQNGETIRLPALAGQVRIVTMFYGSCSYVCPMTIETLKRIDSRLSDGEQAKLGMLLVSVDPDRDTPEVLSRLVLERKLDSARWTLASAKAGDVRKIAAVLGVQYRQLANKEFNHSTILTLISPEGRIVARSSIIGSLDSQFVAAVRAVLAKG